MEQIESLIKELNGDKGSQKRKRRGSGLSGTLEQLEGMLKIVHELSESDEIGSELMEELEMKDEELAKVLQGIKKSMKYECLTFDQYKTVRAWFKDESVGERLQKLFPGFYKPLPTFLGASQSNDAVIVYIGIPKDEHITSVRENGMIECNRESVDSDDKADAYAHPGYHKVVISRALPALAHLYSLDKAVLLGDGDYLATVNLTAGILRHLGNYFSACGVHVSVSELSNIAEAVAKGEVKRKLVCDL